LRPAAFVVRAAVNRRIRDAEFRDMAGLPPAVRELDRDGMQ
jgi:hypothetical protein